MPFHLSAQAKLLSIRPDPARSWLLARSPLELLRSDALAALHRAPGTAVAAAPRPGALDAHYAAVLRSGWDAEDLAVAVSCSTSPMGHLQSDSGTLVLGTRGHWLIADPGYQQYAPGDERDFTLGPTAHNAPVVNGQAVAQKRPRRLALEEPDPNLRRLAIDLTACYPATAEIRALRAPRLAFRARPRGGCRPDRGPPFAAAQISLVRASGRRVVVRGRLGDAARGWRAATARLAALPPHRRTSHRLPGSRGQLTLVSAIESAPSVVWWAFAVGPQRGAMRLSPDGRELIVRDRRFRV